MLKEYSPIQKVIYLYMPYKYYGHFYLDNSNRH